MLRHLVIGKFFLLSDLQLFLLEGDGKLLVGL